MFLFEKRFIYKPIYASLKKIEAASFDETAISYSNDIYAICP